MKSSAVICVAVVMVLVFLQGAWGVVTCVQAASTGQPLRVWVSESEGGLVEPPGVHLPNAILAPARSRQWWIMLVVHGLWTVAMPGLGFYLWRRVKR